MLKKSNESISIFLDEETLRVAHLKGTDVNAKIVKLVSQRVSGIAEAELPKVIQSALKSVNTKQADFFYIIPPSMVTTKNIEVPSVDKEEIKSIVSLQAGRHTPFSREEIQIGYINIGEYKSNYTKILLVIANKNTLKKQLAVFEKLGLKVKKVLFGPEGIASVYSEALGLKTEATPTGLIDIAEDSVEFTLAFHGSAITSRNIPIGKSQLASVQDGEESLNTLIDELSSTMDSYQSEDIEQLPSNYLITTDDDVSQKLQNALIEKLKWMVEVVPYGDYIQADKKMESAITAEFKNTSLLDVSSALLIADKAQVNLMPEELQLQKSVEEQGREVFFAGVFGFIILILVACILGTKIYFHNVFLTKLKEGYTESRKEVAELQEQSLKTKIIQNYLESRMISLDTINEIYNKIPNEIYLTALLIEENGEVSIQGVSDIASLIYNLGTDLKESELFKSVNVKSTTARKDRDKPVTAFEITLKLKNATEEEKIKIEQGEG